MVDRAVTRACKTRKKTCALPGLIINTPMTQCHIRVLECLELSNINSKLRAFIKNLKGLEKMILKQTANRFLNKHPSLVVVLTYLSEAL